MPAGRGVGLWGGGPHPLIRRIFVFAGNYREFVLWCKENGLKIHDPHVVYVQDFTKLMGMSIEESKGDRVVFYGTYESRMDWFIMVDELKSCWRE